MQQHELLLPVGNKEMALAAIHNGADAIYIGMPGFNARGRSTDFSLDALRELIELAHTYGVKVNLAFNILIFENELEEVRELLANVLPLKPDALIVQDLGLVNLIREMAPDQPIHASTQMTVTNWEAISLLEDLQIKRFVLGRENSISEIQMIGQNTEKELEVFVHGALCVAYSGQCFTSESIGGRSANRGQCAQSCRFSYDLIVDGNKHDTVDRTHLVSPQDLCGIAEIPALIDAGVVSFKIEGRLKSPEYVGSAARSYRDAIDSKLLGQPLTTEQLELRKKQMASTYSRGFFPGWLHGVNHQQLVDGTFSANRGLRIGRVSSVKNGGLVVECDTKNFALQNGDGILWCYEKNGELMEYGSHVYDTQALSSHFLRIEVSNDIPIGPESIGAEVYFNHDKRLHHELAKSWSDRQSMRRVALQLNIELQLNQPARITATDGKFEILVQSSTPLAAARTSGLTDEQLRDELGALSSTIFKLGDCTVTRKDEGISYFLPNKELKEMRRQITEQLTELRKNNAVAKTASQVLKTQRHTALTTIPAAQTAATTKMNVLVREIGQVQDLVNGFLLKQVDLSLVDSVILDFEFGRDYLPGMELLRTLPVKAGIATTRILKPGEYRNLKALANLNPDVILVRNLGALHYLKNIIQSTAELRGDFSLNVTNHLSSQYLLGKGLRSLCASYDLNQTQVTDLLQHSQIGQMEVTVHQYMPSFHMEHCVFAAFLSKGSSWKDCGRPCEKHKVQLNDQFGNKHFIKPDQECRNTMYNAVPQSAARFVNDWQTAGLGFVRFEALHERNEILFKKINFYSQLLQGKAKPEEVAVALGTTESYGLGEGTLSRAHTYQSRKKELHPDGRQ